MGHTEVIWLKALYIPHRVSFHHHPLGLPPWELTNLSGFSLITPASRVYGFLTMGGWFPVSISIFIMGVVPICLSSMENASSFALSSFSKSRLVCLSIGVSFNSGLLYSTKSSCGPISLILVTGVKSYSFMRVLTSNQACLFISGWNVV